MMYNTEAVQKNQMNLKNIKTCSLVAHLKVLKLDSNDFCCTQRKTVLTKDDMPVYIFLL